MGIQSSISTGLYWQMPKAILCLDSGRYILIACEGTVRDGYACKLYYFYSDDYGQTWSSKQLIADYGDPYIGYLNLSAGVATNGAINLISGTWDGANNHGMWLFRSTDNGITWSSPVAWSSPTQAFYAPYGKIINLGNGQIMSHHYEVNATGDSCRVYVTISNDYGETWGDRILVNDSDVTGEVANETSLCHLGDGYILGVARRESQPYGPLNQFLSADYGLTWTYQGRTPFENVVIMHPAELNVVTDLGCNLMVECLYGQRYYKTIRAIYAYIPDIRSDGVSAWLAETDVVLATMRTKNGGYQSSTRPGERRVGLTVYTNEDTTDPAHIGDLYFAEVLSYGQYKKSLIHFDKVLFGRNG